MAGTPMVLRSEVEPNDDESFYEMTDESDHEGHEDKEGVTHVYVKGKRMRRVKKSLASAADVSRAKERAKQTKDDLTDMLLRSEVDGNDDESFYEMTDESDRDDFEDREGVTHVYVKGKRRKRVKKSVATAAEVKRAKAQPKETKTDLTDMLLRSEVDGDDDESFYEMTDESDHEGREDREGVTHVYVKGKRKKRVKKSAATAAEAKRAKETKTDLTDMLLRSEVDGDEDESFYELTDESDHGGHEDREGVTHVYVKGKRKMRVKKSAATAAEAKRAKDKAEQTKTDLTDMLLRSEVDGDEDESFYEMTDESDHEGVEDREGVTHVYVKGKRKKRVKKSVATASEVKRASEKDAKSPARKRSGSGEGSSGGRGTKAARK